MTQLKKLASLYPEERIERKRQETDTLASNYVQSLYGLLPTLDLTNDRQKAVAQTILDLAKHVSMAQKDICGEVTTPLQGVSGEAVESVATLTDEQKAHMVALIMDHNIYAAKDETGSIYVQHPLIGDKHPTNEVEMYEIVLDIDRQMSAPEREQVL